MPALAANGYPRLIEPVLHLSLPVADLGEARRFYVDLLGCEPGRVRDGWLDVWFFGLQLTLQHDPDQVLTVEQQGVRHFGVTLDTDQLHALLDRLEHGGVRWLHAVTTDHAGTAAEQIKAKVLDPSGNVIELKAYAHHSVALQHPRDPDLMGNR